MGEAFTICRYLQTVNLPDGLVFIGTYAFNYNGKITSMTIPKSIKYIESYAFSGCVNLTSLTFLGTVEEWNAVVKERGWNNNITEVVCSNGTVTL